MDLLAYLVLAFAAFTVFVQVRGILATRGKIKLAARVQDMPGARKEDAP